MSNESQIDVAVLVGSLRKESLSRKVALTLASLAPERLKLTIVEIGQLPLYNQDCDDNPPREWTHFRERINTAQGVLFVTPEYNRSIPGALKNALDVGSRPHGHNVWDAKPGAVVSVSPGNIGGFGANHHLRQPLTYLNVFTMAQPEMYIGGAHKLFDEQGELIHEETESFLRGCMIRFEEWVMRFVKTAG